MKMIDFGDCCTAKILTTFRYDGLRVETDTYQKYVTNYAKPELLKVLGDRISYESQHRPANTAIGYTGDLRNLALVFATVNVLQPYAFKFLKEVGFRNTKKTAKNAHIERELYGLFADGHTLQDWYDNNKG